MHCPKCGQEQISGEVRFCRSCGLALNSVKDILEPAKRNVAAKANRNAAKGMRQGLAIFLFGMFLIPLFMLIPGEIAGIPNLKIFIFTTVIILGLARMCYPFAFINGANDERSDWNFQTIEPENDAFNANFNNAAQLSESKSIPITDFKTRSLDTAELIYTPSVTEATTKLLAELDADRQ